MKRRKVVEETEMDITPMIDVTFLLLIFFILTNNASKTTQVVLPKTNNSMAVNRKESVVLTIFKSDDAPQVYLSDGKKENGPASMADVTAYVRDGVLQEKRTVIILSDTEVPAGFVEEVALAASEASETELQYFTGVLEKK
jgi:biopolymer transport protein ExbD